MNAEHATAYLFLLIAIVVSCAIPFFGEKVRARRLARQYAPLLTMPVREWSDSVMINLDNLGWGRSEHEVVDWLPGGSYWLNGIQSPR